MSRNLTLATSPAVRFSIYKASIYISCNSAAYGYRRRKFTNARVQSDYIIIFLSVLVAVLSTNCHPVNFPFQRMRDPALSESGAQAFESISKHVLCCGDVLHGGLRGFRAGHLAIAALHGHHDLRGTYSATDAGTRLQKN